MTYFYQNPLHRATDQAGYDYWMYQIQNGLQTRTQVLTGFSESPENQLQLIGVIQDGIEYTPASGVAPARLHALPGGLQSLTTG